MEEQPVAGNAMIPVLLACLQQQGTPVRRADLARLTTPEWASLEALAADQRVRPLLYHRLKEGALDSAVPAALWQRLHDVYQYNARRNLRRYAEVQQMAAALQTQHIPMIVLKGVYLAETVYRNIALREMSDIDVLVHREHLAPAAEALTRQGYHPMQPFRLAVDMEVGHHLTPFVKPGVATIEIHWNLTTPHQFYSIEPDELWDRVVPVTVGNVAMWGLSPTDLLLHLCAHTSYQHQFSFGLRPSCDLAATIHRFAAQLDWDVFCQRARAWHWTRGSYLALRLARDLVGAEVPEHVLATLRPADLAETMVQTARLQIFTATALSHNMSTELSRLWSQPSTRGKARVLWQRIFLPRQLMAKQYALSPDSRLLPFYYLVRCKDLLRRHGQAARQLLQADAQTTSLAARQHALQSWLTAP